VGRQGQSLLEGRDGFVYGTDFGQGLAQAVVGFDVSRLVGENFPMQPSSSCSVGFASL